MLGALAWVAWRLWGKRRDQDVDDYNYSPSGAAPLGHTPSASVGTENTLGMTGLEKYDQPHMNPSVGNANTATNF